MDFSANAKFGQIKRKRNLIISILIVIALAIELFQVYKYKSDIKVLQKDFVEQQQSKLDQVALLVEGKFSALFQAIRTMSYLPGVKNIDRHGENFQGDSRAAVQQIYNNAYLSIQMSEVYLSPASLDPDKIDPVTKAPEAPAITFDEFIAANLGQSSQGVDPVVENLPEMELYEYRLMQKQISYFQEKYPTNHSFKGLDLPAVLGAEVVTCDNSQMTRKSVESNNDSARMGFVYSVPVYSDAGKLNGAVSAVVRTEVIRNLLPKGWIGLVYKGSGQEITNHASSTWAETAPLFRTGKLEDSKLIFAKAQKLNILDKDQWELWASVPDQEFWNSTTVQKTQKIFYGGLLGIALICIGLMFVIYRSYGGQLQLETMVAQRTSELNATYDRLIQAEEVEKERMKLVAAEQEAKILEGERQIVAKDNYLSELKRLIDEIRAGRLSARGATTNLDGTWATAMSGINEVLEQISEPILEIQKLVLKLSEGDLRFYLDGHYSGDFKILQNSFNATIDQLNQILGHVNNTACSINSGSKELAQSSNMVAQGATESAASIEEISSSMHILVEQTTDNAKNASQANNLAILANQSVQEGNTLMSEMVRAMSEVENANRKISVIIKVVDEIAFQTNLLALNAAVEAARAGSHGKGFAVVAEEVRSLAARSSKAAKETSEMIETSISKALYGAEMSRKTQGALAQINKVVDGVLGLVDEINQASIEQSKGLNLISLGLEQLDQVTQQNSAVAEEAASFSSEHAQLAIDLERSLMKFKLKDC